MRIASAPQLLPPRRLTGPPVWDVSRVAGLGSLNGEPGEPWTEAQLAELRRAVAGILVRARGADLIFVGRSPEPLRAYLGGLLEGVAVPWRVETLNVSLLSTELSRIEEGWLRALLAGAGLSPRDLVRERRRAALVDVVASGGTFVTLHAALRDWATSQGLPERSIRRRVSLIGLKRASYRAPGRHGWSAHPGLRDLHASTLLLPPDFWTLLAEQGPKLAPRCPPQAWPHLPGPYPEVTRERMEALRLLRALHVLGTTREERERMAGALARAQAQTLPGLRALIGAWRGTRRRSGREARPRLPHARPS